MNKLPGKYNFHRGLDKSYNDIKIFFDSPIGEAILDSRSNGMPIFQVCVRNEYINIYWKGCSVLRFKPSDKKRTFAIHPKYISFVEDIEQDDYISLVEKNDDLVLDWSFQREIIDQAVHHEKIKFLEKYIEKNQEKAEIAKYFINGKPVLIDLEIAFSRERDEEEKIQGKREKVADRIDMAVLDEEDGKIMLKLVEVKLASDSRLRSKDEPKIMKQMKHYFDFINGVEKDNILNSYKTVAQNCIDLKLTDILNMQHPGNTKDIYEKFIEKGIIAPQPYLLIIDYDDYCSNAKHWNFHFDKLCKRFNTNNYPKPEIWKTHP